MLDFLQDIALIPLFLTFGAYQIGLWCQKKWKNPFCHPILISVVLVIAVLLLTGYPVEAYQKGNAWISWLMTPATVSLAVPMYGQIKTLRKNLPAILAGVLSGATVALLFILGLCALLKTDTAITVSLLPKSITTAMGIVLSGQNGGIPSLTTAAIIFSGILGTLIGSGLCKLLKLKDPISQGVAFGTASHVIGTSKATELGSLQGAVSSLSLTVAGILTAVLFPLVCAFL